MVKAQTAAPVIMTSIGRVLRAAPWRSLGSEGVLLQCGMPTWALLREACGLLCSGRGRGTSGKGKLSRTEQSRAYCPWSVQAFLKHTPASVQPMPRRRGCS